MCDVFVKNIHLFPLLTTGQNIQLFEKNSFKYIIIMIFYKLLNVRSLRSNM